MTIATAEPTDIVPRPVPGDDDDIPVHVETEDRPANDTAAKPAAKPATLAERLARAEEASKRQREQKRGAVAKQRELQAERDRLAKDHETSSGELAKMRAAIARFADDGDEEALAEAGLPADLYDRLTVSRMQPEATKAQREAGKKERELQARLDRLETERQAEKAAQHQAAVDFEKKHLLKLIRDDESLEDLHVYDDARLLKWAGREAARIARETGQGVVPWDAILKALADSVTPHHAKVIELHQRREQKRAEAARSGGGTKPAESTEPTSLTGDLSSQRGGPRPKAKDADELRERMVQKLADKLGPAPEPKAKPKK